ncbi:MAG TPA: sugar MFS transporter [Bacteroidales bacterium]|nr:sugar MFS transporter [Bacteroidales bacterium]HPT01976.1 sugar MFS transporter [Bacteroidales bacterium]
MAKDSTLPVSGKTSYIIPITVIGILFFIFGFITWLNGTLIPFLKISCELNNVQAYFVTLAFYIAYFVMAPPSTVVLHKVGFKNGMAIGLFIIAIGSLVFIPAALTRTFGLFLTGLFIQGTGLALLQTASNPYVIVIGPRESAAKRVAIMGICNKVAGALSPLILGAVILNQNTTDVVEQLKTITGADRIPMLDLLAHKVILPYIIIAIALALLSIALKFIHLPDVDTDQEEDTASSNGSHKTAWWQFPHLWIGFATLFLYVGAEVIAGDTIILYGLSQGIPLDTARTFTTFTLLSMVLGYIIGIITIPKFISQSKALAISAVLGVLFALAAIFTPGLTSVVFIALLGLANAIMWPAIFPLSIADLGRFTKAGSALLIMGIAGGALIPLGYGKLVEMIGNQQAYWVLLPIYIFIFYFAVKGHKIRK